MIYKLKLYVNNATILFFIFIYKYYILYLNVLICQTVDQEELSLLSTQLVGKFIFYVGLHTKKSLRGNAMEWYDLLAPHIRNFASVRAWFARNMLFNHPQRYIT